MTIPIFNTYVHPSAFEVVKNTLESTFLSEGKLVQQFENKLSSEFGMQNVVALNSGTTALHLALILAGIEENDEVILPAQTFVASGLVVIQQKAVPVFADIDYSTGNISPSSIESKITSRTKAIMAVHWAGYPCDMDSIQKIADKHGLTVIEDAAHALGAKYKNQAVGSISDFTCFSFQAIKHLTTGDGGALACKRKEDFDQAMIRRWFGIDRANAKTSILGERSYNIKNLGFKYHLNDYAAALGLANMQDFHKRLAKRIDYANLYSSELKNIPGITLFSYDPENTCAFWLYGFHVEKREEFIKALADKGITASVVHQRIDRNEVFGGIQEDLVNQQKFDSTQIHIPLHDNLDEEKANYIISTIKKGW